MGKLWVSSSRVYKEGDAAELDTAQHCAGPKYASCGGAAENREKLTCERRLPVRKRSLASAPRGAWPAAGFRRRQGPQAGAHPRTRRAPHALRCAPLRSAHVTRRAPIAAWPGHLPPGPAGRFRSHASAAAGQDGAGQRGPHREGAAARLPQAAPGPREHYRLRPPHSFRMAPVTALPWCTRTSWLPCSPSILPEEETAEG